MNYEPIAANLAVRAARAEAGSARPDAPVVPERPRRTPFTGLRLHLASDLRAVAGWVEPAPRRTCQPG